MLSFKKTAANLFLLSALATLAPAAEATPATYIHAGKLLDRPGQPPRGASTLVIRDGRIGRARRHHAA